MTNSTDRRSDIRKSLRQPVSFQSTMEVTDRHLNLVKDGIGIDVSSGGMGMTTSHQLKAGEIVRLFIPVTANETKVPVFSQVMWSRYNAGEYTTGLRFLK